MMATTPNMRELADFSRRYLRGKERVTVDAIAADFGIDPRELKASWRAVIQAAVEGDGWAPCAPRGTGMYMRP